MDYLSQLSPLEAGLLIASFAIVACVLFLQSRSYSETKKKIIQLRNFFPNASNLGIIQTSITKDHLRTKETLDAFLSNPPARHIQTHSTPIVIDDDDDIDDITSEEEVEPIVYTDIDLIKTRQGSDPFKEIVYETNSYLCKNVGTSADFSILQDICERKLEALETQISNTINVPLYLGLGGTFIGIITGLFGIAFKVDSLFSNANMSPLTNLLVGVVIAMIASLVGLSLMVWNSSKNYKEALDYSDKNKNAYYDFLRRELMPSLSNSMASSLNSLKSVLGEFIGKFGHNLDAYANSAELLNDNIKQQHLLLVEINRMKEREVAVEIAQIFSDLKDSADSLTTFRNYQDNLNETIEKVNTAVTKIDGIIKSFDDFSANLKVVVANQATAGELQTKFQTAIERHFPTGSEAREMWRKQFDELSSDATSVSGELNRQLKASTEYIRTFVDNNREAFNSLSRLNEVINKLVEYANVQATCYTDLKKEIQALKEEQVKAQQNATTLNRSLLSAVQEMINAIKTIKN